MNEEKLLELLKDLVGGDRAFQWVGEQMGKGIHKSYDKTHKAAHAVIGGMALVCRGGHNPAAPVPEEMKRDGSEFGKGQTAAEGQTKGLDEKVDSVLKGYGLNEEEKRYCKGTFDDIASEAKQAFENEQDPKLKAAAGVHALDKGIKSSVEFFGAAHSLGMKGEQGLDEYFKNDEEKKESFLKMTGMGREYEKLQAAKLEGNEAKLKAAEKQLMQFFKVMDIVIGTRKLSSRSKNIKRNLRCNSYGTDIDEFLSCAFSTAVYRIAGMRRHICGHRLYAEEGTEKVA